MRYRLSTVTLCLLAIVPMIAAPATGRDAVAFVSAGDAARLGHIRRGSEVTVAFTLTFVTSPTLRPVG